VFNGYSWLIPKDIELPETGETTYKIHMSFDASPLMDKIESDEIIQVTIKNKAN
jgi:hypothetical protein